MNTSNSQLEGCRILVVEKSPLALKMPEQGILNANASSTTIIPAPGEVLSTALLWRRSLGILDIFRKRDEVIGTKVLVCAIENRFDGLVKQDAEVYKRSYPATTETILGGINELIDDVGSGFDIVHLFCDVKPNGEITDIGGRSVTGTELINKCSESNVKLLWIASDNQLDGYKTFDVRRKRINLVMTLRRLGPKFSGALDKLLSRMSSGETMPVAWNNLWPQIPGSEYPDAPESLFLANRGGVRLL